MTTILPVIPIGGDGWLDDTACAEMGIESFFVQAGHVIDEEVLNVCRGCPVRSDCVTHAYDEKLNVTGGYFGGLSPGQRREMNLEQALNYIKTDTIDKPRRPVPSEDLYAAVPEEDDEPIVYS